MVERARKLLLGRSQFLLTLATATLARAPLTTLTELAGSHGAHLCALAIAAALLGAALALPSWKQARIVAIAALAAWTAATLWSTPDPQWGLVLLVGLVGSAAVLWPPRYPERSLPHHVGGLIVAGIMALNEADHPGLFVAVCETTTYLTALAPIWLWSEGRSRKLVGGGAAIATLPLVSQCASLPSLAGLAIVAPLVGIATICVSPRPSSASKPMEAHWIDTLLIRPSRALVLSFLALGVLGTVALALPGASTGAPHTWLDAAFTAVSASCVTGLVVLDTPHAFSGFGQLIILLLIQVGGLGIMVFSAAAVVLLGRRLSLSHERTTASLMGVEGRAGLKKAILRVLRVTAITEAAGAILLTVGFMLEGERVGPAAWRGVFTSISAFCNAGFALQSDSLVAYANNPLVLGVTGAVIIVGGLGPPVVAAMATWPPRARWPLHARLVVWATAGLLVVPGLLITVLEWNGTLHGLSLQNKLFNGAFQSVTLRTAGFNSIDLASTQPATWTTMVVTMFVGGSPGSTAGGIKTTTLAAILLAIASVIRGHAHVEVFGRSLAVSDVMRALAVTSLGVLAAGAGLVAIQLTQSLPLDVAVFEVVSALATVGLSTGGTGMLDDVGKLIIIVCMFTGRVGPLTLFVFFASNARPRPPYNFPDEHIPIG